MATTSQEIDLAPQQLAPPGRPAQDYPAQDCPAQDRPAQDRPAQDRPAQDTPAQPPSFTLPFILSTALAILLAASSIAGLAVSGLYRDAADSPYGTAASQGVNLVDLAVAVPLLVGSMLMAARGSGRASMVWIGVLAYVVYDYTLFAFDVQFNRLFLVYVAVLSLAAWSLLVLLVRLDVAAWRAHFTRTTPRRAVSVFLLLVAALFLLTWLKDIVPAIVNNTTPRTIMDAHRPTNPVYVLDLAFLLPSMAATGIWLWLRRPWGYTLAGPLLVQSAVLGLSIIATGVSQTWQGQPADLSMVPVFAVLTLISAALAGLFLRSASAGA